MGDLEWERIENESGGEWEGEIEFLAEQILEHYGGFLKQYPRHPRAGDALFKVAKAHWALGGYPEVFDYLVVFGTTGDDRRTKRQYLDQWFDTRIFGGWSGAVVDKPVIVDKPDAKQAAKARKMFRDLIAKYPSSESAPMAAYYSAVILDYCLNDSRRAMIEYGAFTRKYPQMDPFVEKANRRIAALRERR